MSRLTLAVGPRDHFRGSPDAPVILVEYGDYECPACGQAHPVVESLLAQAGGTVTLVFRNFPLTTVHPHAQLAAEAAEAAGAQNRFWDMHDTLFENQHALDADSLLEYAASLDLDVDAFANDLTTRRFADRVREDFLSGVRSGVNGTPTFFINGERHDGGLLALRDAFELAAAARVR
jgi:protein-disulfide isomerase